MTDLPLLDDRDQRILGALMEKQVTVPSTYPMTLNALRTACNQSSSRDPVTDHDDATIEAVAKSLKERGLLRIVWADRGPRTLKYHQLLTEELGVDVAEAAVLTVLLLRGPQAPGELRSRTERLHRFADREDVEEVLERMAASGWVRRLAREPGQRDQRWAHRLSREAADAPEAAPAAGVADVLADGPEARDERVRRTYGTVAADYAAAHRDVFGDLPLDRMILDRVVEEAGTHPVADVGCGTGSATAYLHGRGARVRGFDLTPEMIEQARALLPDVELQVADLRRLMKPVDADGWGAIVAWYSLIHLTGPELPDAIAALARTLRPGGVLALAVQSQAPVLQVTEWMGHQDLDLAFVRHEPTVLLSAVEQAGLEDVEWYLRGRRESEQSDRLYVVARRAR